MFCVSCSIRVFDTSYGVTNTVKVVICVNVIFILYLEAFQLYVPNISNWTTNYDIEDSAGSEYVTLAHKNVLGKLIRPRGL